MKRDEFEENEKINPWVAAGVFVGMMILAAIICAILWNATHKDKQQENTTKPIESIQDVSAEEEKESEEQVPEDEKEESQPEESAETETTEAETTTETEAVMQTGEDSQENDVVDDMPETVPDESSNSEAADEEEKDAPVTENQAMTFAEVADTVTAKDVSNLRSVPSTVDAETIVGQLQNGEILSRTGINEATGWSRLDYNGQTVYAVSGYLTTELTYEKPVQQANHNRITTQDGRVIDFTDCDDYIRPKHYVNLRTEPSTSQGESTVKCQITYADIVHRTGYSEDSGWSRVEFYGEVLYVVSSYMYSAE